MKSGFAATLHTPSEKMTRGFLMWLSVQLSKSQKHRSAPRKAITIKQFDSIEQALARAKSDNFQILALEQSRDSKNLMSFNVEKDSVLLLGNEVHGIEHETLKQVDATLEIPMQGKKESFNVSVASAIALFTLLHPK